MEESVVDELLRRARRSDPGALSVLVETYAPRVFGLVYRLTGSSDAAEELMQETFLRVVRTLADYEDRGRFEAWLFRIAANLARDHVRSRRRRGVMASLDRRDEDGRAGAALARQPAARDAAGPLENMIGGEAASRLSAALAELNDAEREIIMLRHFSELSFREIAGLLGVPLGTALARAHRALARLRELMGQPE